MRGTQDLNIDFTTSQLNDVLKSLTAVDLGEGRVSSVRYNSIAPLDERLKSLRLPFGEQVTQAEYLSALRGARVEVRSGSTTAAGRLLSVEKIRKQRSQIAADQNRIRENRKALKGSSEEKALLQRRRAAWQSCVKSPATLACKKPRRGLSSTA